MQRIFRQTLLGFSFFIGLIMSLYCTNLLAKQLPAPVAQTNHYSPSIDIAQYALHQGDSRSANLIEAFIPLYQSAPNTGVSGTTTIFDQFECYEYWL